MAALPLTTIFSAVSTAFSVIGAISDSNSRAESRENEAAWRTYNATIDRQNADASLQASAAEQARQNRSARRVLGEQRASVAQSGTGFGGSNLDILDQSATLAELDMLNIAYEGQMRARGFNLQAEGGEWSAGVERNNARNARRAGVFSAGRSLLTGFGSMGGGGGFYPYGGSSFDVGNAS